MSDVALTLSANGTLREKDVKRGTKHLLSGQIGPLTLYYAGATAPIISSAMGVVAKSAFKNAQFSDYWTMLLGAIIAALAGITWFLIFLRWSYQPGHGRGTELTHETNVEVTDAALIVTRGPIRKEIGWSAVKGVKAVEGFTTVEVEGAEAVIIPSQWFEDKPARLAFQHAVSEKAPI